MFIHSVLKPLIIIFHQHEYFYEILRFITNNAQSVMIKMVYAYLLKIMINKFERVSKISRFEHIYYQFIYGNMSYGPFEENVLDNFRGNSLQQRQQQQQFTKAERL